MKLPLTMIAIFTRLFCFVAGEIGQFEFINSSQQDYWALDTGFDEKDVHVTANDNDVWHRAACKGVKLLLGTTLNPSEAALHCTPLTTPWQGSLFNELIMWGYNDVSYEADRMDNCDFKHTYHLERAFKDLGISPYDSHVGGPNQCFTVNHFNGPAVEKYPDGSFPSLPNQYYNVNGRRYRVTGGHFTIGVNGKDGYIFFLDRVSTAHSAHSLWGMPHNLPVPQDELPALRSSSDIAWGFWNRVSDHNLGNVNGFMSICIVNEDTADIIDTALERRGYESLPAWPGIRFDSGTEEYNALLGSPNGLAAGYFLAQHKKEMGGNKYISHIIVFNEEDLIGFPHMFFKVEWAPNPPPPPPPPPPPGQFQARSVPEDVAEEQRRHPSKMKTGRVLESSPDGRQMRREHVIWAN
ncbi:uncharacterized protein yc1106_00340 [Curvularia clavata]|uniref:Secreted protein n=1 Tax=Curvularia clavata TaxID=95742 RepID=A0A9Q8YZR5_CURCL|nr:uncharacterized protein yc1106_00340 [Curvularia clavata]